MGGIAADDWRVTVTFSHAARAGRADGRPVIRRYL